MTRPTRLALAIAGVCAMIVSAHLMSAGAGGGVRPGDAGGGFRPGDDGCVTCHTKTDEPTMHPSGTVKLGCVDCHGGNASIAVSSAAAPGSPSYEAAKKKAHPQPKNPGMWKSAANPERAYTAWLRESQEYIQFVNPGDLRVVDRTCATCHAAEVRNARTSMMTHGAMLWGAALYNNGAVPFKTPRYGESYAADGTPQRLQTYPAPT